jgi:biopolymer transport protein ExbD
MSAVMKELAAEEVEMEMTPMIDVTFLLLIFFMCTLKFKVLEGKLAAYLPKDVGVNSTEAEPIEKVEILIRVRETGLKMGGDGKERYNDETGKKRHVWNRDPAIGAVRVLEYTVMGFRTNDINEVEDRLAIIHDQRAKQLAITNPDKKVPATIDARGETVYGDITPLLDAALNAGFEDLTFVGRFEDHINK